MHTAIWTESRRPRSLNKSLTQEPAAGAGGREPGVDLAGLRADRRDDPLIVRIPRSSLGSASVPANRQIRRRGHRPFGRQCRGPLPGSRGSHPACIYKPLLDIALQPVACKPIELMIAHATWTFNRLLSGEGLFWCRRHRVVHGSTDLVEINPKPRGHARGRANLTSGRTRAQLVVPITPSEPLPQRRRAQPHCAVGGSPMISSTGRRGVGGRESSCAQPMRRTTCGERVPPSTSFCNVSRVDPTSSG
jgi:hypothetical protein